MHSLDFPIDVDYDMPPALDVLIAACHPHLQVRDDSESDSLFYPMNFSLTTLLKLSNYPILEAVRNSLFPTLPDRHYLQTVHDKLDVLPTGASIDIQVLASDSCVATVIVTLPVRYRGGAFMVHPPESGEENFQGRGGKSRHMKWIVYLSDCAAEVELVQKGCHITLSYVVHLKNFSPAGIVPDPLIMPNDS